MSKLSTFLLLTAAITTATPLTGTASMQGRATPKSNTLRVVAVVGCVEADSDAWVLTNASGPIVVPTFDGQTDTGSGVTFDRARAEPAGKERYRVLNLLPSFGVPERKGQRVLAKGLLVGEGKDRRINLVALETVAPSCR